MRPAKAPVTAAPGPQNQGARATEIDACALVQKSTGIPPDPVTLSSEPNRIAETPTGDDPGPSAAVSAPETVT